MAKKKIREGRTVKDLLKYISEKDKISIRNQCELLEISRSSYYFKPCGESEENLIIMRIMDEHHIDYPTHGVKQMQDYLIDKGFYVNEKRVRRLMHLAQIEAIYPGRNTSKLGIAEYIRPYILRNISIERPNQVWEIDITYIAMEHGFMYLTAIIDVYSRYIVGWDISNSLDAKNVLEVLKKAIAINGKPEIINSDQGSQFTNKLWIECLECENIKISMDGKGRALDNIYIERFWRTIKRDYVYLNPAENGKELYLGIKQFINYYNMEKHHQGIDRMIPFQKYQQVA